MPPTPTCTGSDTASGAGALHWRHREERMHACTMSPSALRAQREAKHTPARHTVSARVGAGHGAGLGELRYPRASLRSAWDCESWRREQGNSRVKAGHGTAQVGPRVSKQALGLWPEHGRAEAEEPHRPEVINAGVRAPGLAMIGQALDNTPHGSCSRAV